MAWVMGNACRALRKVWVVEKNGKAAFSTDLDKLLKKEGVRVQMRGKEGQPLPLPICRTPDGWGSPSPKALVSPSTNSKHFPLLTDITWLIMSAFQKDCSSLCP